MTGDSEGAGNPPKLRIAFLEAEVGASEAEFLRDVDGVWALVTRYRKLMERFAELRAAAEFATGPPDSKKAATVLALVEFLDPDRSPADANLVLELLPEGSPTKDYNDAMRGMIAAAVATLRCSDMETPQIEQWLGDEIKRRALDFTATNSIRWFRDCSGGTASVTRQMLDAFCTFRPEPSYSMTEAEAKKRAASMLDTAAARKIGPLTRKPRHASDDATPHRSVLSRSVFRNSL